MDLTLVQQGLLCKDDVLFMSEPFYVKVLDRVIEYLIFAAIKVVLRSSTFQ